MLSYKRFLIPFHYLIRIAVCIYAFMRANGGGHLIELDEEEEVYKQNYVTLIEVSC